VLKDDVEKLITSKDEAKFHDTSNVLSSTWSQTFKQYFESNVKQELMQHDCDFITRKFAAFKDGVVTNNTSESMNDILKSVANYKELPLDTVVLVFVRVQEIY